MALAILTSLNLAHKPADLGGPVTAYAKMSPDRLVADVQLDAAATVLLYRWSETHSIWIASAAGAVALGTDGTFETRWDTAGISGRYCLVRTAGNGQGSWQPEEGR